MRTPSNTVHPRLYVDRAIHRIPVSAYRINNDIRFVAVGGTAGIPDSIKALREVIKDKPSATAVEGWRRH